MSNASSCGNSASSKNNNVVELQDEQFFGLEDEQLEGSADEMEDELAVQPARPTLQAPPLQGHVSATPAARTTVEAVARPASHQSSELRAPATTAMAGATMPSLWLHSQPQPDALAQSAAARDAPLTVCREPEAKGEARVPNNIARQWRRQRNEELASTQLEISYFEHEIGRHEHEIRHLKQPLQEKHGQLAEQQDHIYNVLGGRTGKFTVFYV